MGPCVKFSWMWNFLLNNSVVIGVRILNINIIAWLQGLFSEIIWSMQIYPYAPFCPFGKTMCKSDVHLNSLKQSFAMFNFHVWFGIKFFTSITPKTNRQLVECFSISKIVTNSNLKVSSLNKAKLNPLYRKTRFAGRDNELTRTNRKGALQAVFGFIFVRFDLFFFIILYLYFHIKKDFPVLFINMRI